ncbi:winged helix-turn-helix transcriptional regulator [Ornithinimicrobium avium]|uniref:Transcriptional regulator n=1 Tax=Ornithinimicrobium avium TaxID=2283195 RepID=A0A345NPV0_9MICO|nr:helix-turn-helix domain-containing protein [Ornithinimicrobium avium]AXH97058.1 transcriptional regulator [Ornithinimicrobium avium]
MSGDDRHIPGPGLHAASRLLGRPWTLLILATLAEEPRRFTEIVQMLRGISTNLLSDRLRTLDGAGLIERQDGPSVSSYSLTPAGQALGPVLDGLEEWGQGLGAHQPAPPT